MEGIVPVATGAISTMPWVTSQTFDWSVFGRHESRLAEEAAEVGAFERINQRRLADAARAEHFDLDPIERLGTGQQLPDALVALVWLHLAEQLGNLVVTLSDGHDLRADALLIG